MPNLSLLKKRADADNVVVKLCQPGSKPVVAEGENRPGAPTLLALPLDEGGLRWGRRIFEC